MCSVSDRGAAGALDRVAQIAERKYCCLRACPSYSRRASSVARPPRLQKGGPLICRLLRSQPNSLSRLRHKCRTNHICELSDPDKPEFRKNLFSSDQS